MTQSSRAYDLGERTARFSENVIVFCNGIKQDTISRPLITQLVRAATSIGANYMEANGASSRKDFRNKIFICKKEAQETKYWLRMMWNISSYNGIEALQKEVQELILIFQKISSSLSKENVEN